MLGARAVWAFRMMMVMGNKESAEAPHAQAFNGSFCENVTALGWIILRWVVHYSLLQISQWLGVDVHAWRRPALSGCFFLVNISHRPVALSG